MHNRKGNLRGPNRRRRPTAGSLLPASVAVLALTSLAIYIGGNLLPLQGFSTASTNNDARTKEAAFLGSDQIPGQSSVGALLPQDNEPLAVAVSLTPTGRLLPSLLDAATIRRGAEYRVDPLPAPQPPTSTLPSPSPSPTPLDPPSGGAISLNDFWFVGDSIAVGFHQHLGAGARQLFGRVGAGSSEIVGSILSKVSDRNNHPYGVLLVALGTNDSLGNESTFAANARSLTETARASGRCVVWLTVHREEGGATWAPYNDALATLASNSPNLRLIGWDALALTEPGLLYDDGVHLRPEGYERLWPEVMMSARDCLASLR